MKRTLPVYLFLLPLSAAGLLAPLRSERKNELKESLDRGSSDVSACLCVSDSLCLRRRVGAKLSRITSCLYPRPSTLSRCSPPPLFSSRRTYFPTSTQQASEWSDPRARDPLPPPPPSSGLSFFHALTPSHCPGVRRPATPSLNQPRTRLLFRALLG